MPWGVAEVARLPPERWGVAEVARLPAAPLRKSGDFRYTRGPRAQAVKRCTRRPFSRQYSGRGSPRSKGPLMAAPQLHAVLRHLTRAVGRPCADDLADGELLRRFVARRDEAAFEALARRHAPMVWAVCGRALDESPDVEDAFQATFLVLVRKADAIVAEDLVGNWLYAVACRVTAGARAEAAWRRARQKEMPDMPAADAGEELALRDLRLVLDEELSRLPERYRAPLVLCYLQGKSYEEAARLLGCPAGTVSGRLARARRLLRGRLARR